MLTFTPSRESRCSMDDDVKALVKVAVKNEQRIRPVRIHRMPNKRAGGDFGVLSPYLYPERNTRKVELHCREIFTWVRSLILLGTWNRGQVWKVARKRKSWTLLNFYVYVRTFKNRLSYICARKFYARTAYFKTKYHWKSTLDQTLSIAYMILVLIKISKRLMKINVTINSL